eukprot:6191886-Pleurochrysis_carterae.AAC.1
MVSWTTPPAARSLYWFHCSSGRRPCYDLKVCGLKCKVCGIASAALQCLSSIHRQFHPHASSLTPLSGYHRLKSMPTGLAGLVACALHHSAQSALAERLMARPTQQGTSVRMRA